MSCPRAFFELTAPTPAKAQIAAALDQCLEVEFTFIDTEPLAVEIAKLEKDKQDFLIQWTQRAGAVNPELAHQFVRRALPKITDTATDKLSAWCLFALDRYDLLGLRPAMEVINSMESFLAQAMVRDAAALYEDAIPILQTFVRGLWCRKLEFRQDDVAWTDGEVLYLPEMIAKLDNKSDNFQLFKATIVHLWAQIRYGTLSVNLAEVFARYEDVERAKNVFESLESIRLDARIKAELPGLYRTMAALSKKLQQPPLPRRWQTAQIALQRPHASVSDTISWLDKLIDQETPTRACYQPALKPGKAWEARKIRLQRDKARLREAIRVMLGDIQDEDKENARGKKLGLRERRLSNSDDLSQWQLTLDDKPAPTPENVSDLLSSILLDFGEIPPEYLTPAGEGEYDGEMLRDATANPDDAWTGTYHEEGAFLYPEWDFARQGYKNNWCVLRELELAPGDLAFYHQTKEKYRGYWHSLRKTFELLRGDNRLLRRQKDGENIDLDALVEAIADSKAGMQMSDQIFQKMQKDERNIAVLFMVDMSGSTRGWINDAEREALILMAEALETLGDRYAIYGFSGWSRKRCETYTIKAFDEDWSDTTIGRVCAIEARDYTRMGAPIRHFTSKLNAIEAKTKLLITLSDGKPDDYDLEYRGQYGIEDTRQALYEARREGVHAYCITIDKDGGDYLPHMYGAASFTVLDDVKKLPLKVSDIYRRITT